MFAYDLVSLASIVDLQGFCDFAKVVDGEEKVQIQALLQRAISSRRHPIQFFWKYLFLLDYGLLKRVPRLVFLHHSLRARLTCVELI
jgi:hypothetical protein